MLMVNKMKSMAVGKHAAIMAALTFLGSHLNHNSKVYFIFFTLKYKQMNCL